MHLTANLKPTKMSKLAQYASSVQYTCTGTPCQLLWLRLWSAVSEP